MIYQNFLLLVYLRFTRLRLILQYRQLRMTVMAALPTMLSSVSVHFMIPILFLSLTYCWYWWTAVRNYRQFPSFRLDSQWLFKALTGRLPKNVPSTRVFFQEIIKGCRKFYRDGLCVMWLVRPYLLIYDEHTMKLFFNETAVVNKASAYDVVKTAVGDGLLSSKDEMWKAQRKLLNPAFSLGVLKGHIPIFNEIAEDLVDKLQITVNKPTEDMLNILQKCTFQILSATILGLSMEDEMFESRTWGIMKILTEMETLVVYKAARPWLHWDLLSRLFPTGKKHRQLIKEGHAYVNEIIDNMMKSYPEILSERTLGKYSESEIENRKSLMQILIEQHLNDSTFTRDHVRDHLVNFIAAGFDTTAVTLMWCLYVLGHHPEVQRKACNEIESVVQETGVTYEDLGNLKYLDCVIKESMRLYPFGPIYARHLSREIHCGKYTIPKGTDIVFFVFMLHRNPDVYPEPDKFKPERFANSSNIRPWMHVPFAEGYRNCIGKKFAMMEMKVLLAHVLRRFDVQSLDKVKDEELDWAVALKPPRPLRMLFKPRSRMS